MRRLRGVDPTEATSRTRMLLTHAQLSPDGAEAGFAFLAALTAFLGAVVVLAIGWLVELTNLVERK